MHRSTKERAIYTSTDVLTLAVNTAAAMGAHVISNNAELASALNDVTSGSNGSCAGSYLCTGVAGYDGPTGLGTPNGITAF